MSVTTCCSKHESFLCPYLRLLPAVRKERTLALRLSMVTPLQAARICGLVTGEMFPSFHSICRWQFDGRHLSHVWPSLELGRLTAAEIYGHGYGHLLAASGPSTAKTFSRDLEAEGTEVLDLVPSLCFDRRLTAILEMRMPNPVDLPT